MFKPSIILLTVPRRCFLCGYFCYCRFIYVFVYCPVCSLHAGKGLTSWLSCVSCHNTQESQEDSPCGSLDSCLFCYTLLYVHSSFAIILMGNRELVAWFVFLVSRDCCVALPRGAMGLSAVCDCGIS